MWFLLSLHAFILSDAGDSAAAYKGSIIHWYLSFVVLFTFRLTCKELLSSKEQQKIIKRLKEENERDSQVNSASRTAFQKMKLFQPQLSGVLRVCVHYLESEQAQELAADFPKMIVSQKKEDATATDSFVPSVLVHVTIDDLYPRSGIW